jgi:ribosomal protein S27AE
LLPLPRNELFIGPIPQLRSIGYADVVPSEQHDLEATLADLARERSEGFRWQHSVVDLLKLLDLYFDPRFREWLADTLHVREGPSRSAKQNNALRKAIINELAAAELAWKEVIKFRFQDRRCLNCGDARHWEVKCEADCGKCTTTVFFYGSFVQLTMVFQVFTIVTKNRIVDIQFVASIVSFSFMVLYFTNIIVLKADR